MEFGFRLTLIQTLNLTQLLVNLTLTITSALTRFNIKCEVVPEESEILLKVKS